MLIKQSLEGMGCGNRIVGELDAHAPICISLNSGSKIFIESDNGYVTIWSWLGDSGASKLGCCALDLLLYQMPRLSDLFASCRPLLSLINGALVLHGRVEACHLIGPENFTEVLKMFYADLYAIKGILEP